MVFSSLEFLFFFLPLFLLIYYAVLFKLKNVVLLIASLIFYAWGEPVYILLLILVSLSGYLSGRLTEHFKGRNTPKRLVLIVSIIIDLGVLGFFKYSSLIADTFMALTGLSLSFTAPSLPIGISFYTFQTISYTADVYRGDIKAERSFPTFLTYIAMFPQLIAGPIVRYSLIEKELHSRKIDKGNIKTGLIRFSNGLFKKVLIADSLGSLWAVIKAASPASLSALNAWLGITAFTLQLYFDFSAYADMAVGLGSLMGFHYNENFNYPLVSKSITEFWHRWHMSLSQWFRDYVYIPLGGSRKGTFRHIVNLLIVWALTGIWHGAGYNFLIWGLYYGIILIFEKFIWKKALDKLPAVLRHIYSLFIIILGFGIFDLDSPDRFVPYFKALFLMADNPLWDKSFLYNIINFKTVLIIALLLSAPVYPFITKKLEKVTSQRLKAALSLLSILLRLILFVLAAAALVSNSYSPFLYFRF
ncbi:MAG: MBOAT family protein [Eubacterium sp.]|nr:MBOAT family protein [Eubacterium sp.]